MDGEDGESGQRSKNERNMIEMTGRTANRLERNSRSELYYINYKLKYYFEASGCIYRNDGDNGESIY